MRGSLPKLRETSFSTAAPAVMRCLERRRPPLGGTACAEARRGRPTGRADHGREDRDPGRGSGPHSH